MTLGEALASIGGVVGSFAAIIWVAYGIHSADSRRYPMMVWRVAAVIAAIFSVASLTLFILGIIFSIE